MSATRKWFGFSPKDFDKEWREKIREMYEKGMVTQHTLRASLIEWSSEENGDKFYYECPKCHTPLRHCPDPACAEDGVGHHLFEEDWEDCGDEDIPYKTCNRVYFPVVVSEPGPGWGGLMESVVKSPEEW